MVKNIKKILFVRQ